MSNTYGKYVCPQCGKEYPKQIKQYAPKYCDKCTFGGRKVMLNWIDED